MYLSMPSSTLNAQSAVQLLFTFLKGAAPMTAGNNRNALNREVAADGTRDWSFGLCSCFDACGLCMCRVPQPGQPLITPLSPLAVCWAFWCPCVVYGKTKQRLHNLQAQGTPLPGGGDAFSSDCFVYGCLSACGFGWILQVC
jgi:hypothetical protein